MNSVKTKRVVILCLLLFFSVSLFGMEKVTFMEGPFVREVENSVCGINFDKSTQITKVEFKITNLIEEDSIESFALYRTTKRYKVRSNRLIGTATPSNGTVTFNNNVKLSGIFKSLVLTVKYKNDAELSSTFKIDDIKINNTASEETILISTKDSPINRVGFRIRKSGDDNIPAYRIPGLVTTQKGTLIAVYDVRNVITAADLPNPIDVGISRSTDRGKTWEPMKIIMAMGDKDVLAYRGNGIGDPAILVDEVTGTIWVAAVWSHGNRAWHGSGKGLEPHETGQFMLSKSEDDGITWSAPINITKQIKDPQWHYLLQGPGAGITLKDGTLVFPAQYQDETMKRTPFSTIIYSKDRGETWTIAKGPRGDTTESQVVQLADGSLMLNCRDDRNRSGERTRTGGRAVYTTADLGKTWIEHPTSDWTLPEPNCQASILRLPFTNADGSQTTLAFFNPNSHNKQGVDGGQGGRQNFSLQISYDDGLTWPKKILFDEKLGRGYSSISVLGDSLCILYEGSKSDLFFQKIKLSELEQTN